MVPGDRLREMAEIIQLKGKESRPNRAAPIIVFNRVRQHVHAGLGRRLVCRERRYHHGTHEDHPKHNSRLLMAIRSEPGAWCIG